MKTINNLLLAYAELVIAFRDKYYTYEDWSKAEYHIIWNDNDMYPWPVEINDDYRDISEIYEALQNDFDYDKMTDRKEEEMKRHPKPMKVNFYNYCKYDFTFDWKQWTN